MFISASYMFSLVYGPLKFNNKYLLYDFFISSILYFTVRNIFLRNKSSIILTIYLYRCKKHLIEIINFDMLSKLIPEPEDDY